MFEVYYFRKDNYLENHRDCARWFQENATEYFDSVECDEETYSTITNSITYPLPQVCFHMGDKVCKLSLCSEKNTGKQGITIPYTIYFEIKNNVKYQDTQDTIFPNFSYDTIPSYYFYKVIKTDYGIILQTNSTKQYTLFITKNNEELVTFLLYSKHFRLVSNLKSNSGWGSDNNNIQSIVPEKHIFLTSQWINTNTLLTNEIYSSGTTISNLTQLSPVVNNPDDSYCPNLYILYNNQLINQEIIITLKGIDYYLFENLALKIGEHNE